MLSCTVVPGLPDRAFPFHRAQCAKHTETDTMQRELAAELGTQETCTLEFKRVVKDLNVIRKAVCAIFATTARSWIGPPSRSRKLDSTANPSSIFASKLRRRHPYGSTVSPGCALVQRRAKPRRMTNAS